MILGSIPDKKEPQISETELTEIEAMKKEIADLKKTVEWLKYGLIFVAIFYIYNKFTDKK